MKTSFKKTLIAASAGAALLAAVGTASANSLLFPYFTTASGAQSVLSIASNSNALVVQPLHYVYNYGTACTHYDGNGSITPNDLMQHSVASTAAGGFGLAVSTDASTPFYFPLANSFGFMTVTSSGATQDTAGVITGDMAIVDPTTGLVVSYAGISDGAAAGEGNYAAIADNNFNLTFYPKDIVDTSWFAVVTGDMSPAISVGAAWTGASKISNQNFVYDNDEAPLSGAASKTISCAGALATTDLMNGAQAAALGLKGGLIHALATPVAPTTGIAASTGLILSKMQKVLPVVGAPFAGKQFLHREAVSTF